MRVPGPRDVAEVVRDEMVVRHRIADLVQDGPKTIPELAEALGCPSREVVFWVMAMWRYGMLEPAGNAGEDGHYRYRSREHPAPTE
jgi:hypothetical protein